MKKEKNIMCGKCKKIHLLSAFCEEKVVSRSGIEITVWEKKNKTGVFEHNHIQDGFDPCEIEPKPITDAQKKAWRNADWRKTKARLVNGRVE
jgi:hypothetical protein